MIILQELVIMAMNLASGCGKRAQKKTAKTDELLQPARKGPRV